MIKQVEPIRRRGTIWVPPSKSDSQRTLLLATLANGCSTISNIGKSEDECSMIHILQSLGAEIKWITDDCLQILGTNEFSKSGQFQTGESGLATRLLTVVLSTIGGNFEIRGEGTLNNRSMHFFEHFFQTTGVHFQSENGFLPFKLNGKLKGGNYEVDGSQSSQYISGLLIALPLLEHDSELHVANLKSIPYLSMTIKSLERAGIDIKYDSTYSHFQIPGKQRYHTVDYTIEGDWSSAGYWLLASALGLDIKVRGLNMHSLQADKQIVDAFIAAGCSLIEKSDGIQINGTNRHSFEFDATHCPDLIPSLVTFAALTEGTSVIYGADRLKHKESDRAKVLVAEFQKIGTTIIQSEKSLIVNGRNSISGGCVDSQHDHRIAMCLAIAGLFSDEPLNINHAESVNKSYPQFWTDFEKLERQVY